MDNIVYLLRNTYKSDALWVICNQAADEIQHLRSKVNDLQAEITRLERLSNG